jgi:hypothetical protein
MGTLDPNSLTAIMGAGAKAYGAYNASSAQRSSLDYQASVAANNAQLATDKASIAVDNGQAAVQAQDLKTAQTFGMQRANLGANGVDLGQGSANDILTSTKLMGDRDADQLQTNALREAWGYKTQAADDTSNAAALKSMAGSVSPSEAALTSMLGSAGQVSSAWKTYNQSVNGSTPPANWAIH